MPLQNIVSLLLPLGFAITIGALALGYFYRERNSNESNYDYRSECSDFYPEPGFDTNNRNGRASDREDADEDKCIICLDSMRRFQITRTFICSHKYHKKCIEGWLRYENFCPACRTVIQLS